MARLRKEPAARIPPPSIHHIESEEEEVRRRPARKIGRARYTVPDESSAEESEQPTKLVQKQKSAGVKKQGQIRLPASQSASDLSGKPVEVALGESKRRRRPQRDVEQETRSAREQIKPALDAEPISTKRKSRPVEPIPTVKKTTPGEPTLAVEENVPVENVDDDEEDVEESIWCQSVEDSDASSDSSLPSVRKLLDFPRKTWEKPTDTTKSAPKDFAKQFQALDIFDDDDDTPTLSKPRQKKPEPQSRPGTSSDKENNDAIIRFSPPRRKSPVKRDIIERPVTPPPPQSPSKSKLQSPTKRAPRIPTPPLRQSLDAFWTADTINNWNDQYSPQKPLKSPRKPKLPQAEDGSPTTSPNKSLSPTKRSKSEIEAKKAFETSKIALAESFLRELDQTITQGQVSALSASTGGVQLIWSKTLNSTAGRANWRRETTKTRSASGAELSTTHKHFASIELASKVISTPDRLLNVLAHEFCHLANFMISGVKDQPHGKSFKAWGARVSRAFGERGVSVTTKHTYEIEYKFVWQCMGEECGVEFKRHSRSIDVERHRCGVCKGALVQVRPVPRGGKGISALDGKGAATPVTGYAAFVKEHFAVLKKSMPGATHKEVMEALGKKYRAEKAGCKTDAVDGLVKDLESVKLGGKVEVIELD